MAPLSLDVLNTCASCVAVIRHEKWTNFSLFGRCAHACIVVFGFWKRLLPTGTARHTADTVGTRATYDIAAQALHRPATWLSA